MDKVRLLIENWFVDHIKSIDPKKVYKDSKSLLQELLQAEKIDIPEYSIFEIDGESHAQTFKVQCKIKKLDICVLGQGSSRKIAEQSAANLALKAMGKANGS